MVNPAQLISAHPIAAMVTLYTLSTAVAAMPTPKKDGSPFYAWLFNVAHAVGAGLPRVVAIYFPTIAALLRMIPQQEDAGAQTVQQAAAKAAGE